MADHKSAAEIEREIEAERGALARSLEDLQARFAPDQIAETAKTYMRENGGQFASVAGNKLKENPVAAILTGVGVAWMIAGNRGRGPGTYDRWDATHDEHAPDWGRDRDAVAGRATATAALSPVPARAPAPAATSQASPAWDRRRSETVPGLRREAPRMAGFDARVARADGDADDPSYWDRVRDAASDAADRGREILRDIEAKVRGSDDPDTSRDAFLEGAREGYVAARAREARLKAPEIPSRRRYMSSDQLRNRLTEGTESMSDAARDRVIRARAKAHEAQLRVESKLGEYGEESRRYFDAQPLIGGLLAFGLGAAVGASLPRTRREDEMLGEYRDRAFDEADRIFRSEAAKLQAVAEAALGEARDVANDAMADAKRRTPTGEDAVRKVESRAEKAADRVKSAAEDEAEKQDLGSNLN